MHNNGSKAGGLTRYCSFARCEQVKNSTTVACVPRVTDIRKGPWPAHKMRNNINMKTLLIATLTLLLSMPVFAQSKTVSQFVKKHEPSASFYLYPSTLRMINRENNPDYERLVRHIEKVSFLTYQKGAKSAETNQVNKLQKQLADEQYQELMSFNDAGNQVYFYARGDKPEAYVSLVDNDESLMLLDMQGAPHLPSLMKLVQSDFNFGMIAEMANMVGNKTKQPKSEDN